MSSGSHGSKVLVLTDEPLLAALVGMLVELAGYAPEFALAGERPEDSVERIRPLSVVLLDGALAAARSDLFFARAARRRVGLAIFGPPGQHPELAAWAYERGVPWSEVPIDAARLAGLLEAATLSDWWRSGRDRRRLPQAERSTDGSLVYVDRAGRRWHVYDRRGRERRQAPPDGEHAGRDGADRLFVNEEGETWQCHLRPDEVDAASPADLERQLARARRATDSASS